MKSSHAITSADLERGALCLILHPHSELYSQLLDLAAQLAADLAAASRNPLAVSSSYGRQASPGHLLVLDGGNRFNVYPVARRLRQRTNHVNAALAGIRVARAFTCFEMASLLKRSAYQAEVDPGGVLVLDFLSTFRDENVPLSERQRLLRTCLPPLRHLSRRAPLLVTVRTVEADPDLVGLVSILRQAADRLLELDEPSQPPDQLALPLDEAHFSETNHPL